jgi:methionyl-tRNA formyltransferase
MKVIFAGTPEFARVALERLHRAGFEVRLVLTQPDRPAGRGMKLQASPVKQFALDHGIAVAQPRSLRLDGKYPEDAATAKAAIEAAQADVMIVAAYGLILPQWVLDALSGDEPSLAARTLSGGSAPCEAGSVGAKKLGCLNIHASLLPRWRGAAPIHRALQAGDSETGITIMQMDVGLDTGDMLLMEKLAIAAQDTTPSLHDKLAVLGGRMIVEALEMAACGSLKRTVQPSDGITYAAKIDKSESAIDWQLSATQIERKIRAFAPSPGCSAVLRGEVIKLCAAQVVDGIHSEIDSTLGNISAGQGRIWLANAEGVDVLCGETSLLKVTALQRAGGKRLSAAEFLRGFPMTAGEVFESAV